MMDATWKRRYERQQRQKAWQQRESAKRAEVRPLRNAVNKALKDAGIPHSKTYYSSRVKGWPMSTSEGWETESVYWSDLKYVRVNITARVGGAGSTYDNAREKELHTLAEKALSVFDYKWDEQRRQYEVYSIHPAPTGREEG